MRGQGRRRLSGWEHEVCAVGDWRIIPLKPWVVNPFFNSFVARVDGPEGRDGTIEHWTWAVGWRGAGVLECVLQTPEGLPKLKKGAEGSEFSNHGMGLPMTRGGVAHDPSWGCPRSGPGVPMIRAGVAHDPSRGCQ